MPIFHSNEQLYTALKLLFGQIQERDGATRKLQASRLEIRFVITAPAAQLLVDGRTNPVRVIYGVSAARPDLDVELTADGLHSILLGELRLKKALGSGVMKVRGPVWKTFALEEILHHGQALYPKVARDLRLVPEP